jgi:hypothetical protein
VLCILYVEDNEDKLVSTRVLSFERRSVQGIRGSRKPVLLRARPWRFKTVWKEVQ